eukprot:1161898-Pelagomonas_calceolata.AAC.7
MLYVTDKRSACPTRSTAARHLKHMCWLRHAICPSKCCTVFAANFPEPFLLDCLLQPAPALICCHHWHGGHAAQQAYLAASALAEPGWQRDPRRSGVLEREPCVLPRRFTQIRFAGA